VPEPEVEDVDRERRRGRREHMRRLCKELKSLERKTIDTGELVFILLKLLEVVLDENNC
jgi:hypothetical protein